MIFKRVRKIAKNTWQIGEFGPFGFVEMYLAVGGENAVLIDSGYGRIDLAAIVQRLTDKPVQVIFTHGHIDHANGGQGFECFLHENDVEVYGEHTSAEFVRKNLKKCNTKPVSPQRLDKKEWDLGNRKLKILHTPGHTKGSICVIDMKENLAFVGDTINPWDVWMGLEESTSVSQYQKSLKELLELARCCGVNEYYSGHCGKPMNEQKLVNYIDCCQRILDGNKGKVVDKGICKGYKTKYKNAAIIWRRTL